MSVHFVRILCYILIICAFFYMCVYFTLKSLNNRDRLFIHSSIIDSFSKPLLRVSYNIIVTVSGLWCKFLMEKEKCS